MLRLWNKRINNNFISTSKIVTSNFNKQLISSFSSGHHSDSEHSGHEGHSGGSDHSDHEHHHHHEHGGFQVNPPLEDYEAQARSRIFRSQIDTFSVDKLLESMKTPINKPEKVQNQDFSMFQTNKEYIDFLATSFEHKALQRYPDYKKNSELTKLIPNFEKLNKYQQEVYLLNAYLLNELDKQREDIRKLYSFEKSSSFEESKERIAFFSNIIKHEEGDNRIMHHLKEKLEDLLKNELEFEKFKNNYNEIIQKDLIKNIVEKKKENFYFQIVENKKDINLTLSNMMAPNNKYKPHISGNPHDHIHPQHYLNDPDKADQEKWKYLAYWDIYLDQYIRQVRPSDIDDHKFKYVKDRNKPEFFSDNHIINNVYYDYLFSLDNEFYKKFYEDVKKVGTIIDEIDKNRPEGKHWKYQHKFPHVADRLGWEKLQETVWDKNHFYERVDSNPLNQYQPFVQTPSYESSKDLNFEEGEVIYENKFIHEWIIFWKLLLFIVLLPIVALLYESYATQTWVSPEYLSRFVGFPIFTHNIHLRGRKRKVIEEANYWGEYLWNYQHWMRRSLLYIVSGVFGMMLLKVNSKIGSDYIIKAVYNREKDLVFVTKTSPFFRKHVIAYEKHYLEQTIPSISSSWKNLGLMKKNGILILNDLRSDEELWFYMDSKYWNSDVREEFFDSVTTYWKGLKHRDVNRGLWINNSNSVDAEDALLIKKTNEEIKNAISKHGPLNLTDYDLNYRYQLEKRVLDLKKEIVSKKVAYSH